MKSNASRSGIRDCDAMFASRTWRGVSLLLSWLAVWMFVSVLRAADAVSEPQERIELEDAPANAMQAAVIHFPEGSLDLQMFGKGLEDGRKDLELRVRLKLKEIDRNCRLSDEQKEKLLLAARGDFLKLWNSVAALHKKFNDFKDEEDGITQTQWQEISTDLEPLRTQYHSGLTGEGSLFRKAVRKVLDPEQLATFDRVEAERAAFRQRTRIALAVAEFERAIPLREEQRIALSKMLIERKAMAGAFVAGESCMDLLVVMTLLSNAPEAELQSVLDDKQRARFGVLKNMAAADGVEFPILPGGAFIAPDGGLILEAVP